MLTKSSLEKAFETDVYEQNDNYKLLCPVHPERTPSFYVHKETFLAHCFGCGISGYIDSLFAKYSGLSQEAAAASLGISIQEKLESKFQPAKEKSEKYIPESWLEGWRKELHNYVLRRGFERDVLISAGARYDPVHKRQVFPHYDREGRLLGAAGRSCIAEEPKWYFYWSYNKSRSLYCPFGTSEESPLVIVEGIFDYLWLVQNGIKSVAALLGCSASSRQIQEIKQRSSDVILALDSDDAGRKGAAGMHRALRRTCEVRFAEWPESDPVGLRTEQISTILKDPKNIVQRHLIRDPKGSSREALQQKADAPSMGTRDR